MSGHINSICELARLTRENIRRDAAAGTTERTIARLEDGDSEPRASTAQAIKNALEASGVEFTNGDAPGVRLAKPKWKKSR